jgi:hypothetical protein
MESFFTQDSVSPLSNICQVTDLSQAFSMDTVSNKSQIPCKFAGKCNRKNCPFGGHVRSPAPKKQEIGPYELCVPYFQEIAGHIMSIPWEHIPSCDGSCGRSHSIDAARMNFELFSASRKKETYILLSVKTPKLLEERMAFFKSHGVTPVRIGTQIGVDFDTYMVFFHHLVETYVSDKQALAAATASLSAIEHARASEAAEAVATMTSMIVLAGF